MVSYCESFKYLGSKIDYKLINSYNIDKQINKARQIFYAWHRDVYQDFDIPIEYRVKFYKALVINTLLWGCKGWALKKEHIRKMEVFHHAFLRSILRITKSQHIFATRSLGGEQTMYYRWKPCSSYVDAGAVAQTCDHARGQDTATTTGRMAFLQEEARKAIPNH